MSSLRSGTSSVSCADSFPVRGEAGASLGDLIHRKRSPFPLRGEGEASLGDLIRQLR